ncbi:MAG: NAD(P)H-hydrate epimerase [Chloroflexi bacterium]|nr:NAD(P)H-hydrate epimerase [Chloroflexota bacterium]
MKTYVYITTDQMREVDRAMIEDFGILLIQMMENAGRNLAELVRRSLGGSVRHRALVVLAGAGNNGGGGLVAARHLSNWGAAVRVVLSQPAGRYRDVPAHQLAILQSMSVPLAVAGAGDLAFLPDAAGIVDALIGYGLRGNPREPVAGLIRAANASGRPIWSLDAPSGLDTTSGVVYDPCIRAEATLTLALPKTGLQTPAAQEVVGQLYLADISVPPLLYERMGIEIGPLFERDTIVAIGVKDSSA